MLHSYDVLVGNEFSLYEWFISSDCIRFNFY